MGFLSGIVHAIGSGIGDVEDWFSGDNKKKQWQNQPQPQQRPQQQQSNQLQVQPQNGQNGQFGQNTFQPQQQQNHVIIQQQQQQQLQPADANTVNLTNLQPNQLQKAAPTPQAPQAAPTAQAQPAQAPQAPQSSFWHNITHNPVTNLIGTANKDVLSAAGGAALATTRAAEGAVQGITQLPDQLLHAGNAGVNAAESAWTGKNHGGVPDWLQQVDQANHTIQKPMTWLGQQTDNASKAFGQVGADIYKPAQVAANVIALVPAATSVLSKAPVIGSKIPTAVTDIMDAQKATPTLNKAVGAITNRSTPEIADGIRPGNTDTPPAPAQTSVSTPGEVTGPNGEQVPQISQEAPNATPPVIHTDDPVHTQLANAANDTNTPAFMRVDAKNKLAEYEAAQEAAAQKAAGVEDNPAVDSPSYQRQGKTLASEQPPTPAEINDGLNNNAMEVTKDPANADMVNQAYRTTGSANPLSLVAHTLSTMTNKASVRELVQKLVPEAKGNALNRMVNSVTGADNQADVLQALHEGSASAHAPTGPLGSLSTAEAPTPSAPAESVPEPSQSLGTDQPAPQPQRSTPEPQPTEVPQNTQPASSEPLQRADTAPNTATLPEQLGTQPLEQNGSNVSSPPNVAQTTDSVKPIEGNGTSYADEGLKNSRYNQAVVDGTKDPVFKAAYQSDPITKDGADLSQLQDEATKKVTQMSLPELAANYGHDFEPGHTPITNPSQYYEAMQAIRQLEKYSGDPAAADAAANALRGVNEYAYNQGRGLAATKVAYDNLPTSMKVAYISKLVNKLGGELNDADLAKLMAAADQQGKLAEIAQKATQAANDLSTHATETGTRDGAFNTQMKQLLKTEEDANSKMYDANRAVVDIIDANLPKSSIADRLAQSARTSMLSSVGGRAFALINTGVNTALHMTDNTLSSVYGRGINAVTKALGKSNDTNKVTTALPNPLTLVKGAGEGAKGLVKEVGGNAPVKDVTSYLKGEPDGEYSHDNTRYGWLGTHVTAPFRKVVRLGVGSHLALTKGVDNVALEQAGREAAKAVGVPAENLKGFLAFYKAHPPTDVAAEAKQAWLGVNNLQKNGISDAFQKMAGALETAAGKSPGKSGDLLQGAAKQVRTVMIPFSHYMGGFVAKALTDRNMVYNSFKVAKALKGGDTQVLADQLAHLTTNTGLSAGLGYTLAAHGLITDKNQAGKNYDGGYLHLPGSNRYIPLGIAGQASVPLSMGATFYNSMHDGSHGGSFAPNMGNNFMKLTGVAGSFGTGNNVITALSGNTGPASTKIAESAVQQHIPGIFGDANALINQFGGDPSHQAALTKSQTVNQKTGNMVTDNVGTALNKLKAAIPGLQQSMPRDPNALAPTEEDRALHAGNASAPQAQALANAQAAPTIALQKQQAQLKIDKKTFEASGKNQATINGNVYEKDANGKTLVTKLADYNYMKQNSQLTPAQRSVDTEKFKNSNKQQATYDGHVFEKDANGKIVITKQSDYDNLTQNGGVSPAQRSIDQEKFKNSGKQMDTINGVVYERADDGKITGTEQKDYDYKTYDAGMAQAKSTEDVTGFRTNGNSLLNNISTQLQNPHLSQSQRDTLVNKAMTVNKSLAENYAYNGFNKDGKMPTFKGVGDLKNAKPGWTQQIQQNAAKYNLDPNALLAVSAMEGLGGGVGDGGHAFGPFQMNDAGGVLTGKFNSSAERQAYAESPQGIEDAIKQIAAVAQGKRGEDAIRAIVTGFERPANPDKEIAGALGVYNGGDANLTSDGSGTQVSVDGTAANAAADKAARNAADLVKSNVVGTTPNLTASSLGKLAPAKVSTAVPILQKIIPSDLVKKRSISVATVHP